MPLFADIESLVGAGILIGLVITAGLTVIVADWRLALAGLAIQYLLLAFLLSTLIPFSLATVRVVAGILSAFILYISMRYRSAQDRFLSLQSPDDAPEVIARARRSQVYAATIVFRLFAVVFVAVTIIGVVSSLTFLGVPTHVLFSSLWLMALGLLTAMLTRDTLRLGVGILLFSGGASLLETAIEGSLLLFGLLSLFDLILSLVIAHLATLGRDVEFARRRGDEP